MKYAFNPIPFFEHWLGFSGSIPEIFWNVYSQEQRYKFLCKRITMLVEYANMLGCRINANAQAIEELAETISRFETDDYWTERVKPLVEKWIDENLDYIYRYTIKQIYFGLDDSGHLIAWIPESWEDISFFTPLDYSNQETYGHLQILLKDVIPYIEEVED